jgi:hypothetical protein
MLPASFVRRGLPGEVLLVIARIVHIRPSWLVLFVQISCYVCLLLVFRRLTLDSDRRPWVVALLISPATLSFPLFTRDFGFKERNSIFLHRLRS